MIQYSGTTQLNSNYSSSTFTDVGYDLFASTLIEENQPELPFVRQTFINTFEQTSKRNRKALDSLWLLHTKDISKDWIDVYNQFLSKLQNSKGLSPAIPYESILSGFQEALKGIIYLCPQNIQVDVSKEDECVFIFTQFGTKAFFYNIFYSENGTEILLNVLESNKPVSSFCGSINQSLHELKKNCGTR